MYDTLESDSKNPLYSECEGSLTLLSAVLSLVNVKARYRRSDKNFTSLLKVVQGMLPEENTLPKSYYEVKKILCWMGMEYKKIHTCPNDCILYIHEFEEMQKCSRCRVSGYKVKDDDECSNDESIEKVPWRRCYDIFLSFLGLSICLPMEMMQKTLHGMQIEEITMECSTIWLIPPSGRGLNFRLGLVTYGMNPFGSLSIKHSSWPILLVIYNLAPWLCMKQKYMMLFMMISGSRQSGNDIDVYLSPLIEDLRKFVGQGG